MRRVWRLWVWTSAVLIAGSGVARLAHAQQNAVTQAWSVVRDPFTDLWFQTVAETGFDGGDPLRLYAASHPAGGQTAAPGSTLSRRLERDSAFEVLHFVPLYFSAADPGETLEALRQAADGAALARTPTSGAARLIADALPTRPERDALGAILSTAKATLGRDVVQYRTQLSLRSLDSAWQSVFLPALRPVLGALGIAGGTIVVSQPVGADGRIVRHPGGRVSIVVGRIPESRDPLAPLLAAVRELAFSLVRTMAVPTTNERTNSIVATRAGALLLDVLAPQLANRYRSAFRAAAIDGANRPFEDLFPIDAAQQHALRAAVASVMQPQAQRQ